MNTKKSGAFIVLALLLTLILSMTSSAMADSPEDPGPPSGDGIQPAWKVDNPTCSTLAPAGVTWFEVKVEPVADGIYGDGFLSATVDVRDTISGPVFDWSSNAGIDAIFVKGGSNGNLYQYDPPAEDTADTSLHAPVNPQNTKYFGLSHISFCYDLELDITKDAAPTFTRTFDWAIDKSVTPDTWDLFTGDSGTSEYAVSVTKTGFTDSGWAVSGNIWIENNTPLEATITNVSDIVSPNIMASADCGVTFPYTLSAGADLHCTYNTALPDGSGRTNTVTVATGGAVGGGSATTGVIFGDPTTLVNDSISVNDSFAGDLGSFNDSGSTSYYRTFICDGDEGSHDNTATIVETGQSDNAAVTVNCYALEVTKDARTSLTRTWNWTIDKSVTPATWDLFSGDSAKSDYSVSVNKVSFTDGAWAVAGDIWIANPHPSRVATLTAVSDVVSPDIAASVDCPSLIVPAGGSLHCTYSADLPDGSARTNTATATLQNYDYDAQENATASGTTDFSSVAVNVDFSNATITEVNASIRVDDTYAGDLGTFSDDGTATYERTFTCDGDEGTHGNMATIVETGQSDDASVTVNCYALVVTKDADTSLTRTWEWTIDKSADQSYLLLSEGQLFQVNYEVTVDASFTDSDWTVEGDIWIENANPSRAAMLTAVSDVVSPDIAANVDCPPLTVPAGGSLHCSYSADLPDNATRTNTATAKLQNYDYASDGTATAAGTTDFDGSTEVNFTDPEVTEVDECIDVTDTNVGFLGTLCAGNAPHTFTYSLWFGRHPDADVFLECGNNTHNNIASFITNDTGATGEDDWTVTADVACDVGCTLTPGYWKTHSEFGPAPYDDTWAMLANGANTTFFISGRTYHEALWTSPQGNAYYILAQAYIAAQLNQLNNASIPSEVLSAFDEATGLFIFYTPDQVASAKGKTGNTLRQQFIDLAETLDDYNNGLLGPGHCSE